MKISLEHLYHFGCDCGKWFTIADFNLLQQQPICFVTCPHCGVQSSLTKEELDNLKQAQVFDTKASSGKPIIEELQQFYEGMEDPEAFLYLPGYLTPLQQKLLILVFKNPGKNQQELAKIGNIRQSVFTSLERSLIKKALLEKHRKGREVFYKNVSPRVVSVSMLP